jgi:hypothetical protein
MVHERDARLEHDPAAVGVGHACCSGSCNRAASRGRQRSYIRRDEADEGSLKRRVAPDLDMGSVPGAARMDTVDIENLGVLIRRRCIM